MRRQWRLVLCLLLLISLTVCTAAPSFNPYSTLGVSKDATSDEIRRNYRKLCLKFHPDKNVQKSVKERKKCEETFKKIQKANGLIGDEEARRNYEQSQVYSFPGASSFGGGQRGPSSSNADSYSDVFRRYYEQQQRGPPPTRFYFGGVDISKMFSSGPPSFMPRSSSLKSKYIQRVKVPLQDLYRGKYGVDLPLQDVIWNRYGAAFRGGVASTLLYEALIISVSMIRVVRFPWSFLVGAVFFHAGLPKPSKLDYTVDLQAGWKAGTKLKFCEVEPGFDVVFIIEEAKHARYHRVGNDLYTTITITETQRREGCTVKIDPLDADEGLISIELEANQILNSGDRITISGMGWPGKKGKNPGDLLVSVKVTRRTKKKKTKERRG